MRPLQAVAEAPRGGGQHDCAAASRYQAGHGHVIEAAVATAESWLAAGANAGETAVRFDRGRGSGKPVVKNPINSRKKTNKKLIVVCLCDCPLHNAIFL